MAEAAEAGTVAVVVAGGELPPRYLRNLEYRLDSLVSRMLLLFPMLEWQRPQAISPSLCWQRVGNDGSKDSLVTDEEVSACFWSQEEPA